MCNEEKIEAFKELKVWLNGKIEAIVNPDDETFESYFGSDCEEEKEKYNNDFIEYARNEWDFDEYSQAEIATIEEVLDRIETNIKRLTKVVNM